MIAKADLERSRECMERSGEGDVGRTGPGIARWMVVHEKQRRCLFVERTVDEHPVARLQQVMPAHPDYLVGDVAAVGIKEDEQQDLAIEPTEPGRQQR